MKARTSNLPALLLGAGLALSPLGSHAEDIDIFIGSSGGSASAPHVILLLDNNNDWTQDTPNGKSKITAIKTVLDSITSAAPVNVGLAMFARGKTPTGAYIRFASRDMSVAANRTPFKALLDVIATDANAPAETGNPKDEAAALFEIWRYFSGLQPVSGTQTQSIFADKDLNVQASETGSTAYAQGLRAGFAFNAAGLYNSPTTTCSKSYIIYIAANNSTPSSAGSRTYAGIGSDAATTYDAGPALPDAKGALTGWGNEWARYLYTNTTTQITTYVIDAYYPANNQDAGYSKYLQAIAKAGGGSYTGAVDNTGTAIQTALLRIFAEIQSVNTTFASASLPVNATNRAQNQNQVFIGMFRPDPDAKPRWFGNMKQYQLINNAGSIELGDANGATAINPLSGFLADCATSFYTSDSGTYWQNVTINPMASGKCTSTAFDKFSDSPDGPFVEKGGVGEVVRKGNNPPTTNTTPTFNPAGRTVTTLSTAATPAIQTFNTTNTGLAAALVDFTVGKDVNDENANGSTTDTRASLHGDVIHSRPLPLNYGGTIGTVVFYGANDGDLRAIDAATGKEKWAFIAREHYSKLQRLNDQTPLVKYPDIPLTVSPQPKDYFFDGSIGAFQNLDNTKVWIYPSMRRGGRMIYAFDVTDPANPSFKWNAGCPNAANDTGCTAGLTGIGQTWALPVVAFIKGYSTTKPVVILGGGYDSCEDQDAIIVQPASCATPKGAKVYILDADTGTVLQTFNTTRSVAAEAALIDIDSDQMVDYGYVADTGGNIYRLGFRDSSGPLANGKWTIDRVAYTSGAGRKFLFEPALLFNSGKVFVAMGTGDREHPLPTNYPCAAVAGATACSAALGVTNRFYVFRDDLATSPTAINLDDTSVMIDNSSATTCGSDSITPTSSKQGWFMTLTANGQGEQVVTSAVIAGGLVTFSTNRPIPAAIGSCTTILGEARGYFVNVLNASGAIGVVGNCGGVRSGVFAGGGLPPSPVLGNIPVGGTPTTVVIGAIQRSGASSSPIGAQALNPPITQTRRRVYWYTPGVD